MSAQATAASWAAVCSHQMGDGQPEVDFLNLHIYFTLQYGIDQTHTTSWQLQHPNRPGCTAMESAGLTLLDRQAFEKSTKPGGWSTGYWSFAIQAASSRNLSKWSPLAALEEDHDAYLKRLQPELSR